MKPVNLPTVESFESRLMMSGDSLLSSLLASAQDVQVEPAGAVSVESNLQSQPFDVYQFTAPARGVMYINMSSPDGSIDPMLKLLNSKGRRIRINDNAARGTQDSLIKIRVRAGATYYLVADGKGLEGRYRVGFTSDAADDYGNTDQTARTVTLSRRDRAALSGTINYTGDTDVFKLTATKTGTLALSMQARSGSYMLDPLLTVVDAEGNQLAQDDNGGMGNNAALTLDVVAGQVYYVRASAADTVGRYTLAAAITPAPAPQPEPTPEPTPDSVPAPVDLTPGSIVTGTIFSTAGGLQLQIAGTNGNDVITLSQTQVGLVLTSAAGTQTFSGDFASVVIYSFGGNDTVRTAYSLSVSAYIDGGDGNDQLFANGQGAAVLVGGAGDDLLVSIGGDAATLTGGEGSDSFWYDGGDQVTDASTAEQAIAALHRVSQFYQPYGSTGGNYVPLTIDGQNLADPAITSYASGYRNFANRPLFVDGPQYNDITQGSVGDCYFLAALAGLADSDPGIITQSVAPMGDGTYAVRFIRNGQSYYLRLDADLPVYSNGSLAYARMGADGELWAPMLEKAFAYFRTGANSYASIEGGWMNEVYPLLTGQGTTSRSTTGSAGDFYTYLSNHLAQGHATSLGSRYGISGPIVGSHAYDVKSVQTVDGVQYVTVYNPWGVDGRSYDSNSSDGLLTLTIAQAQQYFTTANVSLA